MATFQSLCRTNYFKVKDPKEFEELCKRYGLEFICNDDDPSLVGFYTFDGWPTEYINEYAADDEDEIVEIDIVEDIIERLEDGHVAIIMETGYESARYCHGYALAVNSKGERRNIALDDIYKLANELGDHVTNAAY